MKYATQMRSDAMIHIPSFIKTGSGIRKLMEGGAQTQRHQGDLLSFFQTKESRLKIMFAAAFAYTTSPRSSVHTKAINQILDAKQKGAAEGNYATIGMETEEGNSKFFTLRIRNVSDSAISSRSLEFMLTIRISMSVTRFTSGKFIYSSIL
jgi:hypothetical protein